MKRKPASCLGILVLGLCLALSANPARADTILYNSFSGAPDLSLGTFPIGLVGSSGAGGPEGDSFSTGASPFVLTDVVLTLEGVTDSASFNVSLFNDNNTTCVPSCSGGPLTLLDAIATVSDNSLSTSLANYDFSLAVPQTLTANTRYWIIASSSNGSGTLWSYTADLSGAGVAGEFDVDRFGGLGPTSNEPFQMEVTGTTVPQPSSLSMMSIGLAGLLFGVIRRRPALTK
jgi:hypothetical protein